MGIQIYMTWSGMTQEECRWMDEELDDRPREIRWLGEGWRVLPHATHRLAPEAFTRAEQPPHGPGPGPDGLLDILPGAEADVAALGEITDSLEEYLQTLPDDERLQSAAERARAACHAAASLKHDQIEQGILRAARTAGPETELYKGAPIPAIVLALRLPGALLDCVWRVLQFPSASPDDVTERLDLYIAFVTLARRQEMKTGRPVRIWAFI